MRGVVGREFALFLAVNLVATVVLAIEKRQRVVNLARGRGRGIAKYKIYAKYFIVGTRKWYRPTMKTIIKVLGGCVSMQVTRYRTGHNKGEHTSV